MKRKLYSISLSFPLVLLLSFTLCCKQNNREGITESEANAVTEQVLKMWNEGDMNAADLIYAPGYIRHHPTPSVNVSLDDLKNTVTANRAGFPDYNLTFDEMIIEEDRIIVWATVTGTNTAPIGERPATGKKIHLSGIYVYRLSDGKIAEEWTYFNLLSYYQQLGFTLSPPQVDE